MTVGCHVLHAVARTTRLVHVILPTHRVCSSRATKPCHRALAFCTLSSFSLPSPALTYHCYNWFDPLPSFPTHNPLTHSPSHPPTHPFTHPPLFSWPLPPSADSLLPISYGSPPLLPVPVSLMFSPSGSLSLSLSLSSFSCSCSCSCSFHSPCYHWFVLLPKRGYSCVVGGCWVGCCWERGMGRRTVWLEVRSIWVLDPRAEPVVIVL